MESSASLSRSSGIFTGDSEFTSGCQWLSLMFFILAILEPHIKRKTTNFCELSVQGSIYSALSCEMKWMNLTIAILDFGITLYGGSELSKHVSKCLLRQCVNVIDITWGLIYFSACEHFGRKCRTHCAMTLSVLPLFGAIFIGRAKTDKAYCVLNARTLT